MGTKVTDIELQYIKDNYANKTALEIANNIGKTEQDVFSIAVKYNIKKTFRWTDDKIQYLKENYSEKSVKEMSEYLGITDKTGIYHKAKDLGLKKPIIDWEYKTKVILDNYGIIEIDEICVITNLKRNVVLDILNKSGYGRKHWTDEEREIIKKMYSILRPSEIVEKYLPHRTKHSVISEARKLNLISGFYRKNKQYDEEYLIESLQKVYAEIGRTPASTELTSLGLASERTYARNFGTYRKALIIANIPITLSLFGDKSIICQSKNGDFCYSIAEKKITDFFIDHNISYKKEELYSKYTNDLSVKSICDWVLEDGTFVEYFGLSDKDYYKVKMEEKQRYCQEKNINLMSLYRKDLNKLHTIFESYKK